MNLFEDVVVNGKHSLQEHELKVVKQWCPTMHHTFEFIGDRTLRCKKCGQEVYWNVGKFDLVDGKLIGK